MIEARKPTAEVTLPAVDLIPERVGVQVNGRVRNADRLDVRANLFADVSGDRIYAQTGGMGVGMWRHGRNAIWKRHTGPLPEDAEQQAQVLASYRVSRQDVEDAINQLLGRDPEQHRPPRLAWDGLIEALGEAGINVTENDLLGLPFVFELSQELVAELGP